ncbi:MAG: site-specific integrase [Muribaculaceae bacterium]|nr:site-specific integrase [Muribaculaceae bacterium]
MASIKLKFKPSTLKDREGTVYYQIVHERRVRQLYTKYHLFIDEWDDNKSSVKIVADRDRCAFLQSVREKISRDVERLNKIFRQFEQRTAAYTVDDIADEFELYNRECSLTNFMENLIAKFKLNGKARTSETYQAALNSFKKFLCETDRPHEDIMLHDITAELMGHYEGWLNSCRVLANTVSFYMRILRATYNRAVEDGRIEDRRPFRHVYTGVDKTVKRALPLSAIRKIKSLDLSISPKLDYARDLFLLSFMLRGMSFVDMAFLRKSDLKNGCVSYRRRKTGQQLVIEWTPEMEAILSKYPANQTEYLLPIIKVGGANERNVYRNTNAKINYSLKQIAKMVGVSIPLTMYVARHSWASAAKAKGIPLRVISEGMGHDSENTTQIYLASLDTSVINKANKLILASI